MSKLSVEQRKQHIVHLGGIFLLLGNRDAWPGYSCGLNESEYQIAEDAISRAASLNPWFTESNVRLQLLSLGKMLERQSVDRWCLNYNCNPKTQKKVAIITAGNLPLVGFHDIIGVLVSGHFAIIKPSSDDAGLTKMVLNVLDVLSGGEWNSWQLISGKLSEYDAVIATGSNNTLRYFKQYFGHVPHVLRGNRTSVAVLDGSETPENLQLLAKDVFSYFGLGCRNVGKVFIPQDFDIQWIFQNILSESAVIQQYKYANNYDYFRALYMLNREEFLENGFLIVKEDEKLHSPISVLFVERYKNEDEVKVKLQQNADSLQCVVGGQKGMIPFGQTQFPDLNTYADGVDTMAFLTSL